jgi:serine/threonine protein kinase/cephalosporin-C deacetylase-like acetyl esterase
MIGQTVSHYRILQKLGEGGMGVVYKAQDLRLERLVALKFLPHHICPDEEEKIRFMREAKAASALDHPNIGTVHEITETDDGQMFIVMAHYEGETLKQTIERGPLPLKEVVDLAIQVAQGLAKAHSQQIVHRDIKPSNILVTPDGLVKVIDFGLAKLGGLTKITQTHTTMGTVAYISPEQARGQEVDARSDVWSLGVVLYEMLTRQLPFPGTHAEAIIHSILTAKPKPLRELRRDVPVEIERIILQTLSKDMESRHCSARELEQQLSEYLTRFLTPPISGVESWKQLLRRIKRPRIAIPAIVAVVVLCFTLLWSFQQNAKVKRVREELIPELIRLIEEEKYSQAFQLAEEAEKVIPNDPLLGKFWPKIAKTMSIRTTPPGADVYVKEQNATKSDFHYLGQSPIENIRIVRGLQQWRIKKKGYETKEGYETDFDPDDQNKTGLLVFGLDKEGSIPPEMVRVSAGETFLYLTGLDRSERTLLDEYLIDRYEVTNDQFKRFVTNGGYEKKEYWKHPFLKSGRPLSWEEAMAEFKDKTGRAGPATWEAGDYPKGEGNFPVAGISWYEAAAYADFVGKDLPTIYHWNRAAAPGSSPVTIPLSNFNFRGPDPVGSHEGLSAHGTYDMAGNVREWCWNESSGQRFILGGGWNDQSYMFNAAFTLPPFDRSPSNGMRCIKYLKTAENKAALTKSVKFEKRDYEKEKPVSDQIFEIYKSMYAYDKTKLNAKIESVDDSAKEWTREKISFDAGYGEERVILFLYIPKNGEPPYQAVTYFPGGGAKLSSEFVESFDLPIFDFIITTGRVVAYPIYKGTFERGGDPTGASLLPSVTNAYKEYVIKWRKDLGRAIDYLETRGDIDTDKLAYYGASWGGCMAAIMPAVETRFKASVAYVGGLYFQKALPEVDTLNFAPRVRIPTLMLNGRYDHWFPFETSQEPMFRLLGTPPANKVQRIYETGHYVPRHILIKETLDWLDHYLGPVKRKEQ